MNTKLAALTASLTALAIAGASPAAFATDMPITATKLVIKRAASGKERLVFVSKDPAALFAAVGSDDDPVSGSPGGAIVTVISAVEDEHALAILSGASDPGWTATEGSAGDSYRYRNSDAPSGPSQVRSVILKQGRVIKIVAADTALPMLSAHGSVGIRIETGSLRNCAIFDASTISADEPGRFVAKRATSLSLDDCSNESLGEPPFCGDGESTGSEQCDGVDDAACPGHCRLNCTCSVCGDGQVTTGEECDPPAAQGGLPSCNADCTLAVCGDGDIEAGEDCDPPASGGGLPECRDDCTVGRCGDGEVDFGEECETNADCAVDQACSACCSCTDASCPGTMEITMHAGAGVLSTVTEVDFGSTGIAHDQDLLDQVTIALNLCPAAGSSTCPIATIAGVDPNAGNCRCASDNRTHCDEPFRLDQDDCAGAQCVCYLRPPNPVSSGNTPSCRVWRLAQDLSGTWNVDTGEGDFAAISREIYFGGESIVEPCPTCAGDVTRDDGVRDGTCVHGQHDGLSCDANATDATFPAPGGGAYSYDCFPSSGKNISGAGLRILGAFTTGAATLPAVVPCGFPEFAPALCACGECSGNSTLTCTSNADCAAAGAGTCGLPQGDFPNTCTDGVCNDAGGGEGVCTNGPTDSFCDGLLRANGTGIFQCSSNADCDENNIGVDAGNCTLSVLRECFLDPIDVSGTPSPTDPVLAAAYCVPKTAGNGNNAVNGLPGPARAKIATTTVFRCAGSPTLTYPGCP